MVRASLVIQGFVSSRALSLKNSSILEDDQIPGRTKLIEKLQASDSSNIVQTTMCDPKDLNHTSKSSNNERLVTLICDVAAPSKASTLKQMKADASTGPKRTFTQDNKQLGSWYVSPVLNTRIGSPLTKRDVGGLILFLEKEEVEKDLSRP
ncbi:hypothetical protein YC2023_104627 [Brassica napus]